MTGAGLVANADLVVVGGGPRALYALADLETALAEAGGTVDGDRPFRVTVIDPGDPGAGAVWDPSQPDHLVMNVDARIVDATCPSVPKTFAQWHSQRHGEVGTTALYPPRAVVGGYLSWAFDRLRASPLLQIRTVRALVKDVRRDDAGWVCLHDSDAAADGRERGKRVLLATGHAGGAGIDHAAVADVSSGPAPGSIVVIRGAALTAFDVVLDLTAARGGTWLPDAAALSGLTYVPSGQEPEGIALVARSGEVMLPKPDAAPPAVAEAVTTQTARLTALLTPDDAWWEIMADAAVAAARASGVDVARERLWERLDAAPDLADAGGVDGRWARDIGRATGDVDDDPAWWWGRAWSAGYADVVHSLERGPRDQHTWTRWRERAIRLERWAFGPPLATHRRLLALREAGLLRVDRSAPDNAVAPVALGTHAGPPTGTSEGRREQVVIDAFTSGPGVLDSPRAWDADAFRPSPGREPWSSLFESGLATVRPGERGVHTLADGACVGGDGRAVPGLSALGRPTEDAVIGHDSLRRHLHGDSRRWARAVAAQWLITDHPTGTRSKEHVHG
ncbi:FAD/NAD(P)-binding protein [Demequina sp. NBRC 110053]|uniref:FAD/NAD(P)-binding protein n=1 Tax=Demequina sp. NBRC 110053 TaxID=1570342 RepID=UPI0009FF4834|nr:FAD/NAD(P)-binding domain-containing protein [Demequina sp. NBRC 110053]